MLLGRYSRCRLLHNYQNHQSHRLLTWFYSIPLVGLFRDRRLVVGSEWEGVVEAAEGVAEGAVEEALWASWETACMEEA